MKKFRKQKRKEKKGKGKKTFLSKEVKDYTSPFMIRLFKARIYITISTITSVCPVYDVRHKFFLLKSPWDHPLTTGVDPDPRGTQSLQRS